MGQKVLVKTRDAPSRLLKWGEKSEVCYYYQRF